MEGQTLGTTDPGWGLVTGRCADVGKFKVPTLRGLTGGERRDLVAFLRAL